MFSDNSTVTEPAVPDGVTHLMVVAVTNVPATVFVLNFTIIVPVLVNSEPIIVTVVLPEVGPRLGTRLDTVNAPNIMRMSNRHIPYRKQDMVLKKKMVAVHSEEHIQWLFL